MTDSAAGPTTTEPGTYELPNLEFSYFDPKAGAYRTVTAPGATVIVDAAVAAARANSLWAPLG